MYSDHDMWIGMTQKKLEPFMPYDKTDQDSILRRASRLTGNTLRDFIEIGEEVIGGTHTKGRLGQIVEEGYFDLDNNSSPLPDFRDAGIELKVTPMKKVGSGLVSKERLILGIINYDEVPKRHFKIFTDKDSHILIVFYLWEEGTDILDYEFLKVVDWRPTDEEWRMIRDDWDVIEGYIMRGEAHLLSEKHTKYLAACTKGVGHGGDMRSQPFSIEPAKQRALSFKASFMTQLYHSHVDVGEILIDEVQDSTSILHGEWSLEETFEEHIVKYYNKFVGLTCYEIEQELNLDLDDSSKQYYSTLSMAMAGVTGKKHIKEFEEAGIIIKTIRTYRNGKPKESMSFPYIRFDEIVEQEWQDSDFFDQLDHEFFSPVFSFTSNDTKSQSRKDLVFKGAFFWTISDEDMPVIESVWSDTKQKVLRGDFDHFISMSDNPIAHIRPHARNSLDTVTYGGRKVKKVSFWLKDTYIQEIIKKNLG